MTGAAERVMALSPGTRLGAYEVLEMLGAGGMGEVYRARDHKLAREVAIKVLSPRLVAEPDHVVRFEREAKALAALNHPNVAAIYAFEEFDAPTGTGVAPVRALILELVEGETLARRLLGAKGGLEPVRALGIARQIADALDAAHENGIVHRDLKPANVAVKPGDVVKVLDFGLAKLVRPLEARDAADDVTFEGSREGLVVGTIAYMSPEQARGQPVDRRTDIWAFGCVLYEMLTGRAAFARGTASDTVAAILGEQPDLAALPPSTPEAARRLLRRCLQKDAKQRARDIADVRMELDEMLAPSSSTSGAEVPLRPPPSRAWVPGLAALAAVTGVAAAIWMSRPDAPLPTPAVTRSTLTLPADHELDTGGGAGPLAISPDGRRLAYVASDGAHTQLYLRSFDAFEPRPIAGTEGAQYPFFSPDGEWVAFFADRRLKRVSLQSGAPITICDAPSLGRGGTWGPDGTIVFDPGGAGLLRVSSGGGRPEPLTSGTTFDLQDLSWPQFLPGGRALLATVGRTGTIRSQLAALSLDTMQWHELGPGSQAQYLASGHLIYHAIGVREGELHAVAFDAQSLAVGSKSLAVLDNVFRAQDAGAAYFVVAPNGTLIFAPGGYARTLVQVDRAGRRTPLLDERLGFRRPEYSPDGSKLAVTVDPRPSQVWVYDLARKSRIAIATDGHNLGSLWTPDGSRVTYATDSPPDIFWRAADAGAGAERLLAREGPQYPTSWSADGRLLIFDDGVPNQYDIWVLPLHGTPRPLVATPASELGGQLSPDGRWLAYQSDESGRFEIYVRPFPDESSRRWTISTSGGQRPLWSRDGRELFYLVGSAVARVAVEPREGAFDVGIPQVLFSGPFDTTNANYTISKDGQHFVMVEVDPHSRPTQLQVVLNWAYEVNQRLAASPVTR